MIGHLDLPRFDGRPLCAETDPEAFYPEKGGTTRHAKTLCGLCDVSAQCLAYALDRGLDNSWDGVWGGTTPRERRRLRLEVAQQRTERRPRPVAVPVPKPTAAPVARAPEPVVPAPTPLVRPARRAPRPWTTAEARDAVHTLTGMGLSASEIAAELGLSPRTVYRVRTAGAA